MKTKIVEAHIMHVNLPLKTRFKHALASRSYSDSVFVRIILENGTAGYGESLPREYVTGEVAASTIKNLKDIIHLKVLGYGVNTYDEVPWLINGLDINKGAAKCALELALLDAYGKHFEAPIYAAVGKRTNSLIQYTGVMSAGNGAATFAKSLLFKAFGFKYVKVKVGVGDDIERLRIVRSVLGKGVDIRVDANCAWDADEAIKKITEMRRFGISAVEQPVAADDYHQLKKVTDSVPELIVADESLCSIDDAQRLEQMNACNMFNIRLSKCGGIFNSFKIANIARRKHIGVQLGCQVGESGLLSAAGWHFANLWGGIKFCEGAYGRYLLKEDITKEDITIGRGGVLAPITGSGLGVHISTDKLEKYRVSKEVLAL